MKRTCALLLVLSALGASAPSRINYQGVLRGTSGARLEGSFDFVFRFLDDADPAMPENEILVDAHTAAGSNSVVVTGGAFNTSLGGGTVSDGSGPGNFTSLAQMFRDHDPVYLEVKVNDEVLGGRIRVVSSAYALNADHLDGLDGTQLLRSDVPGTLSGALAIDTGGGADARLTEDALVRNAATAQIFDLRNDGGGAMSLRVQGATAWTAGNDGNGSGLDADLLDGLSAAAFFPSAGGSLSGALALNTGAGADLTLTESGADRPDGADQTFGVRNSGAGSAHLEVDGDLKLGVDSGTDTDSIFFDDGASEALSWDDAETRFELSDELALSGPLRLGELTLVPPVNYNRIALGAEVPAVTDISLRNDLWIEGDLEVRESLYLHGAIAAGDSSPTTAQSFNSIGEASGKDETAIAGVDDLYVAGDAEVDATLFAESVKVTGATIQGQTTTALGVFALGLASDSSMLFMMDANNNSLTNDQFEWWNDGDTTDPTNQIAELEPSGDWEIRGTVFSGVSSFDVAEAFLEGEEGIEPGDLVCLDPRRKNAVVRTTAAYEPTVLGVVSASPGLLLGGALFDLGALRSWGADVEQRFLDEEPRLRAALLAQEPGGAEDERQLRKRSLDRFRETAFAAVALSGRVEVKVDSRFGAIEPGDLLAPSPLPGVAMKASEAGPVIGTALEGFSGGQGKVLVFVHRGAYTPATGVSRSASSSPAGEQGEIPSGERPTASASEDLRLVFGRGSTDLAQFSIRPSGAEDPGADVFRVDEQGNVFARGAFRPASPALAEFFPVLEPVESGDVVVATGDLPGALRLGRTAADPAVIGVISTAPGVLLGSAATRMLDLDPGLAGSLAQARTQGDRAEEARIWKELEARFLSTHAPVALSGSVLCKVDAGYGAIRVGDLLTAAPTAGHAMRATEALPGTVLGKALEPLASGTGRIRILVLLR